jgi:glycosyltransferase involved in cell wall biosynthesis
MQLRAGIFSPSHTAGGLEVRLQDEAAVLAGLGVRSWWFAPPFDGKEKLQPGFDCHGCELVDLQLADPFRRWRWRQLRMMRLRHQARALRHHRLDLGHVALSWTSNGLAQALALSEAGIPFVVAIHNYFPPTTLVPWTRAAATRALAGARTIYAVSGSSLSAFLDIFEPCLPPQVHLDVVENGIDLHRFTGSPGRQPEPRQALGLGPEAMLMVFAGRLDEKKRPHLAVEILAALRGLGVDAHLLLLGDGPLADRARSLAASLGVGHACHLPGHCPDPERFYRAADLFLLPSRSEGLPLAMLEASACGAIPTGYPVPGVADVILDGVTGLLLAESDAMASARHLAESWRDPQGWSQLQQRVLEATRSRFGQETMRSRLAQLYRRTFPGLLGDSAAPAGTP